MARLKALGAAKGQELLSVVYVDECMECVIRISPPPAFFISSISIKKASRHQLFCGKKHA
jgi:hypothetical protein